MSKLQKINLEHLKKLYAKYKLSLTSDTKIKYLKHYAEMLEIEIRRLEEDVHKGLLQLKKQERFGKIKRLLKGSFDLDRMLSELNTEISQNVNLLKVKNKELELTKYELNVLSESFAQKTTIQQEYLDYFETFLANYAPDNVSEKVKLDGFQKEIDALERKKSKLKEQINKVAELKKKLDDIQVVFSSIAYGYHDEQYPAYNILNSFNSDVKLLRAYAQEILLLLNAYIKEYGISHMKVFTHGEEKLISVLTELTEFKRTFNNLNSQYSKYENVLTPAKLRIGEDLKYLQTQSHLLDEKIVHIKNERKLWFSRLHHLE